MTIASKSVDPRQLKNKLAQYLITLGGISVLFTLVLIFLYLLYVIKPIFESAHIEQIQAIEVNNSNTVLNSGLDELKEVAYQLTDKGEIVFYQLSDTVFRDTGSILLTQSIAENNLVLAVNGNNGNKAGADVNGQVMVFAPKFVASYLPKG